MGMKFLNYLPDNIEQDTNIVKFQNKLKELFN